jgi:hypothetical protein
VQPSRHGVSFIELLIAVALLAAALIPVVSMANHNLEMLRSERLRLLAEALCHDVLERLGRSQAYPANLLLPGPGDKLVAIDPWISHPELFEGIGYPMRELAARTSLHLSISLQRAVAPELDLLVCEVSWLSEGWTRRTEKYRYARFLTYGHLPQPR